MAERVVVSAAVEGIVDEAVVHRLILHAGGTPGVFYRLKGKSLLRKRVQGYNKAAYRSPWFVLVDLDHDYECPPPLREAWLPAIAPHLCFRVAVRTVEAWLLAGGESLARFLGVAKSLVPRDPEALEDPKRTIVDLARRSNSPGIRKDMVPRKGSGRSAGPAYTSRMGQFVQDFWEIPRAARRSQSLRRAITCLERLVRPQ